MRNLLLLTAALLLLVSCTKNDFPKKFTPNEFLNGEVRLSTKTGEVTDADEIAEFTQRIRNHFLNDPYAPDYVYSFEDDKDLMDTYTIEIELTAENKGIITILSDDPDENQNLRFNLIKKESYYLISMHDTIETSFYTENPCLKCTPEIIERVPVPGGITKYLRPLYIKKEGDELLVCVVSYMSNAYFNDEMEKISIQGAKNNLINEDYLSDLKNSAAGWVDSIAYKESYIIFK